MEQGLGKRVICGGGGGGCLGRLGKILSSLSLA